MWKMSLSLKINIIVLFKVCMQFFMHVEFATLLILPKYEEIIHYLSRRGEKNKYLWSTQIYKVQTIFNFSLLVI